MGWRNQKPEIIQKAIVVDPPGSDAVDEWKFIGAEGTDGGKIPVWPENCRKSGKKFPDDEDHKVMYVKFADYGLWKKKFLITVPAHFFDTTGKFRADPPYSNDDLILIKYTGDGSTGCATHWIDINIDERGGGGGGGSTEEIGCAKWS